MKISRRYLDSVCFVCGNKWTVDLYDEDSSLECPICHPVVEEECPTYQDTLHTIDVSAVRPDVPFVEQDGRLVFNESYVDIGKVRSWLQIEVP